MVLAGFLGSLPPYPQGWSDKSCDQSKMQAETDVLSFLKQNVERRIYEVTSRRKLYPTHPAVLEEVTKYFNLGLTHHQEFKRLGRNSPTHVW